MKEKLKNFFKNHLNNDNAVLAGNLLAFKGCLNLVKEHFLHKQGMDDKKIANDVANASTEIEKINLEIENKESGIEKINNKIEEWKEKIPTLKNEILHIKENPSTIMKDKVSKVGFYIGLFILLALTIYLFIFYSSASYSGFFKDFTEDLGNGVASAIFDL